MIFYEKLKIAHDLASKLSTQTECHVHVSCCFSDGIDEYRLKTPKADLSFYKNNIDDLIAALTELTHPTAKYAKGQAVWYIDLPVNKIHCGYIVKIGDGEYVVDGSPNGTKDDFSEDELYPTKSELIEAQVAYWDKLAMEEMADKLANQFDEKYACSKEGQDKIREGLKQLIGECQHESDGKMYLSDPLQYKCIKCGEFYR